LLDSTVLIAHLDGSEAVSRAATHLIDGLIRKGRNAAVVSMVSVMEVLVGPLRRARPEHLHVLDFLTRHPNLQAQPIDLVVAQEAAGLRALFGLATPDALVVATGVVAQVAHLVTNDERWKKRLRQLPARVKVVYLADHLPW
jgi:predicted nucleic acid-binding protein